MSQINYLILQCEDKRWFKTTGTGKPLAQVKGEPWSTSLFAGSYLGFYNQWSLWFDTP